MYPVSSGFEEWIHLFVQDSFGQKRETLLGAIVWASEASPTLGCSIEISRDTAYMSVCMSVCMAVCRFVGMSICLSYVKLTS